MRFPASLGASPQLFRYKRVTRMVEMRERRIFSILKENPSTSNSSPVLGTKSRVSMSQPAIVS